MSKRILILCTGNSCRSQMAEGFLKSFDTELVVYSAGTEPELQVNPKAIQVMKEVGIDISDNFTKSVSFFIHKSFDYVITVCDNAKESCPVFLGKVENRIHLGFEDPSLIKGNEYEVLTAFRKTRDEIKEAFKEFYKQNNFISK
ncbi:MAG: arsenate reductase ArsC [Bacteroidetes bacterium]|nr:arsenate reductase ArsC [Bacteroidota bacterium]